MSFNDTLASLNGRPWALADEAVVAVRDMMAAEARGERLAGRLAAVGGGGRSGGQVQGTVMIIPVAGMITQRIDWLGTSTTWISAQLQRALADPGVSGIVLSVASPGGTVSGVPELANEIFRARSRKPIVAFVDPLAASAAYWIAAVAAEVVITPSGQAGSIGVFRLHLDMSGALEQAGVRPTFIKAGRYKTEGSPFMPPAPGWVEHEQAQVDAIHTSFLADVARGRGISAAKVRSDFGEGRCFLAPQAVRVGMADRIGTLADAVGRVAALARSGMSASAAGAQRSHDGDPARAERHRRLAELSREPVSSSAMSRARLRVEAKLLRIKAGG